MRDLEDPVVRVMFVFSSVPLEVCCESEFESRIVQGHYRPHGFVKWVALDDRARYGNVRSFREWSEFQARVEKEQIEKKEGV